MKKNKLPDAGNASAGARSPESEDMIVYLENAGHLQRDNDDVHTNKPGQAVNQLKRSQPGCLHCLSQRCT